MNKFNGYSLFNDTENALLRAHQRCVTARNILEDHGGVMCKRYMEQFKEEARKQFLTMAAYIKFAGYEEAARRVQLAHSI